MTPMLTIRLQKVGKKKEPGFRVVLIESKRAALSGSVQDVLGFYDPSDRNGKRLDKEKILNWISKGAQVSDTMHNLLISEGIITGKKINVLPKKTVEKKPEENIPAEAPVKEPISAESSDVAKEETATPSEEETSVEKTPEVEATPEETPSVEEPVAESVEEKTETPVENA